MADDTEDPPRPDAPVLTLPPEEAAVLRAEYARAEVILEYGSGGSTVLAASLPGKRIFSVESDAGWIERMAAWFRGNPAVSPVHLHHADIGPTAAWGRPADDSAIRAWPGYALSVWERRDFRHPDVVLIDGRFRPACLLTVALRCIRPVTVLFDDYRRRKPYHTVERLLRPVAMVGRMARFEVQPMTLSADRLGWLVNLYLKPL